MDRETLRDWLEALREGELDVDTLLERLQHLPFETVEEIAHLDHHRLLRQGFPEFIYAEGKTPEQVAVLMERIAEKQGAAMATRVSTEAAALVRQRLPHVRYEPMARTLTLGGPLPLPKARQLKVALITGGTSDMPVAEEAAQVLEFLGHHAHRLYDVGVAGLHRLLDQGPLIQEMDALIVLAGMEGALPSVVGGLTGIPLVAVPTSVGYGAHFHGVTPLLAMLNSCVAGVVVTNIDNGFGAALAVHRMSTLRVS